MTDLRTKIARAVARSQDADYWVDEVANWEALEEWERDAYPGEYPGMAYEDQRDFRQAADAVLAVLDLDKVKAEAQVEALREAADEAEAWEVAIHGSAHYDSDVLFSIRDRANRIAREAGIETGEKSDG